MSRASRDFGVPRSTLHDRVSGRVVHGVKPGPKPYLDNAEEKELGSYLKHCAKVGYGKTRSAFYEDDVKERTGKDWVMCACNRWLHDCVLDNTGERETVSFMFQCFCHMIDFSHF